MKRSGRRPGPSETRKAILTAARNAFAERGYDRTSLRAIAADAGVDQALIAHYFGSKQRLFVAVVQLPIEPAHLLSTVLSGDRATIGTRLASLLLGVLEDEEARSRITGLIRAATSEPEAARMVRELLTHSLWEPAAALLDIDHADLRISLVAAQIVGLVMTRYIVAAEPLATLSTEGVVAVLAPALQRLFTEALDATL